MEGRGHSRTRALVHGPSLQAFLEELARSADGREYPLIVYRCRPDCCETCSRACRRCVSAASSARSASIRSLVTMTPSSSTIFTPAVRRASRGRSQRVSRPAPRTAPSKKAKLDATNSLPSMIRSAGPRSPAYRIDTHETGNSRMKNRGGPSTRQSKK
jgi:hypothetical protein